MQDLEFIKQELSKYTKRAYFVGGFVRDQFLNRPNKDIDIEVYDIEPAVFDSIMNKIGAKGVGKSFFVYKYNNIDLSLPRTESKTGSKHTDFDVSYCNDTFEASSRRDLTINSIMQNIFTNEYLDHHNGIQDIKNKLIKCVNKDTFIEDNLRKLRAVRFAITLGFEIDRKFFKTLKNMSIADISNDRIWLELDKIFSAKQHLKTFRLLNNLNLIKEIFGNDLNILPVADIETKLANNKADDVRVLLYYMLKYVSFKQDDLPRKYRFKQHPKNEYMTIQDVIKLSFKMPLREFIGLNQEIENIANKYNILNQKTKFPDVVGLNKEQIDLKIQDKIQEILRINSI